MFVVYIFLGERSNTKLNLLSYQRASSEQQNIKWLKDYFVWNKGKCIACFRLYWFVFVFLSRMHAGILTCASVCVCLSSDSVLRCMVLRSWIVLFQRFVTVLLGPAATARARSPPRLCSLCARRPLVVLTAHHCCHPPCARAPAPGPGNTSATTTPTQNRCRHRGQTETPTGHTHTLYPAALQTVHLLESGWDKVRFRLTLWFQPL